MKKLDINEIKQMELDILIAFDLYCRQKQICYSLGAGTMLGAVRHKGFIPWDDDIDIFMNRADYDCFIQSFLQTPFIQDRYKVMVPGKDNNYFYPYIKIIDTKTIVYERNIAPQYSVGVWIDIFPVDVCADSLEEARKICISRAKERKQYMYYFCDTRGKTCKAILKRFYVKFINTFCKRTMYKIKEEMLRPTGNHDAKYSGTICWVSVPNDVYPSEYFEEYIDIEFEHKKFMVYKNYESILKWRYGDDYMQLPPKEKRISHNPKAYLL